MAIKLIGLYSSAPRCGKSTAAQHLMAIGGPGVVRVPFAMPLKVMLESLMERAGIDPATRRRLMDRDKEEVIPKLGYSFRHLAQTLGTEWGRNQCPGIWIRLWQQRVDQLDQGHVRLVVADDVRFEDEVAAIKERGGEVWRVCRPEAEEAWEGQPRHASEGGLEGYPFDRVLLNGGSEEQFRRLVGQIEFSKTAATVS